MGLRYASGPGSRGRTPDLAGSGLTAAKGGRDYGSRNSSSLSAYNRVDLAWTFVNGAPTRFSAR